jgi:non-ribosomal peptide synthetase component F
MAPNVPLYNEAVTVHYTGPLDTPVLERSFNEILRRHEAWRTSFTVVDGQPFQMVQASLAVSLPVVDLRRLPKDQRVREAVNIATNDARTPLDLGRVPLFRAKLVRLEEEEFRLYLTLIPIASVTAGRNHPETQKLLGYFLNTAVFRADIEGDPTFRQLVERVRKETIEMLEHDNVPFELLIRELRIPREASHNPLFQASFSLEPPLPNLDPAWRLTQMDVDTGATKYDLYLELDERAEEVLARFHYSTDLFDAESIVRMADHWRTLLERASADPEQRVSELEILTRKETNQLLTGWNETNQAHPQVSIHKLFESQVERTPETVAIVFGDSQLTYRELNERANQLAWHLRRLVVGPEILVGLCVERSLEMVVALLGIVKAGGAYLPLDPDFPKERLSFMLSDAKPQILLTQESLRSRLAEVEKVVLLDADWERIAKESRENPVGGARPENLAYVIYTSGSTGKPKGVQKSRIRRRRLGNLALPHGGRQLAYSRRCNARRS